MATVLVRASPMYVRMRAGGKAARQGAAGKEAPFGRACSKRPDGACWSASTSASALPHRQSLACRQSFTQRLAQDALGLIGTSST